MQAPGASFDWGFLGFEGPSDDEWFFRAEKEQAAPATVPT